MRGRQRRRANQVREHHRDLAALGGVLRARPGGCYSRNGDTGFALLDALEIGNGAKQFAAMAKPRPTPIFSRSGSVKSRKIVKSISFSAKRSAYSDMPSV